MSNPDLERSFNVFTGIIGLHGTLLIRIRRQQQKRPTAIKPFCEQTKNSALNFSVNLYVVSVQEGYEIAKFTSFHEGERQGDRFFNIVNYRI